MTRIISGEARGRKIKVPPAGTRPTSDRAREGLFSSLQVRFGFGDARVLDLFAGSGALGLEAARVPGDADMNTFLWVIVPYLCLAVFVVGHIPQP